MRAAGLMLFAMVGARADVCADALELHRAGKTADAVAKYEACLTERPDSVEMRSNYGAVLAREGRYAEAITQYEKAIAGAPNHPQLRFNLALAYYKQGDITRAATELKPLQAAMPGNAQVAMLLADCYLRLGENARVVDLLSPLEAANRDQPGFAYLLGTALIRNGDVKRGEAVVDRILRDANSPEAHFLVGSAAFTNQDFPRAVEEFGKAVRLNPGLPSGWSYYGLSLLFTGDAAGASEAFRKELSANANDYEANVKLGAILAARRQFSEAMPFLEKARLLRPDSVEAREELERARAGKTAAPQDTGLLAAGRQAPDFELPALGGKGTLRPKGPLVLVFGSYSCPKFRFGAPGLNALYEKYRNRIPFAMVYVAEAHGGGEWESSINSREGVKVEAAKSIEEKRSLATACSRTLHVDYPIGVDGMDRAVERAYNAWPSAVYLIGGDGRIAWSGRLGEFEFDPAALEAAIGKVRAR